MFRTLRAGNVFLLLAAGLQAQNLIEDRFLSDGPLAGQLSSPVSNGHPWIEAVSSGAATVSGGQLQMRPTSGNSVLVAVDPLQNNRVYRLSVDVLDSGNDWLGLSLFNVAEPEEWFDPGVLGPCAVLQNSQDSVKLFHTAGGITGDQVSVPAPGSPITGNFVIEVAVDWTGAAELTFLWDGVVLSSGHRLSAEEVDAIMAVGLTVAGGGTPVVDNFVLEIVGTTESVTIDLSMSGTEVVLDGFGGPPHGAYSVLQAPDLTLPLASWEQAEIGMFDAAGGSSLSLPMVAGADRFYRMMVLSEVAVPGIIEQPQDLVVMEGGEAAFTVSAVGAPPLQYQWYLNESTEMAGKTESTLTLANVQSNNAGAYSVEVSNSFGIAQSGQAQLTVLPAGYGPFGWASMNGGTTGGEGGATVVVTTRSELQNALNTNGPLIIQLSGIIDAGLVIQGKSDKTIEGLDANSGWDSFIQFKNCHNIIIRHCNIGNSGSDGITIQDSSTNFWIDHCTLGDCGDGQIDIVRGSDFVTVSWCKFIYTDPSNEHRLPNLIGSSSELVEDAGHLRVTFHHNWWSDLCHGRMPRVRFGQVHVYNNYYSIPDHGGYCIVAAWQSQLLVENNYFHLVKDPWTITDIGAGNPGRLKATGNILDQTTGTVSSGDDEVFTPPYPYILEDPIVARDRIIAGAGNVF
ncbi:MAG: immunoglobulin domain-containing protein [Puniceicoccaceae bacterium]